MNAHARAVDIERLAAATPVEECLPPEHVWEGHRGDPMYTRPNYQYFHAAAKVLQPRKILEIGTWCGYSAVCFARAISDRLTIVSVDNGCLSVRWPISLNVYPDASADDYAPAYAARQLARYPHVTFRQHVINSQQLPGPLAGERFDLILVDGDHTRERCFADCVAALRLLRSGGHLLIDDAIHDPHVADGINDFTGFLRQERMEFDQAMLQSWNGQKGLLLIEVRGRAGADDPNVATKGCDRQSLPIGISFDMNAYYDLADVLDLVGRHFDAKGSPRSYLEIGFGTGGSCGVVMGHPSFAQVFVVDEFVPAWGGCFGNPIDGVKHLQDFFWERRFHNWRLLAGDSKEMLPRLVGMGHKFDLVLIDGAHDELTPAADLENAARLLTPDGFILAHDLTHVGHEEHIRRIWRQWLERHGELTGLELHPSTGIAWHCGDGL